MLLVVLSALGNVRMPIHALRYLGTSVDTAPPEQFLPRFVELTRYLPPGVPVGYLLDDAHVNLRRQHPDERFFLTQYALSPRRVERSTAPQYVIVDADDPDDIPETAILEGWVQMADCHNGVKLFRKE